jgi:hypothetical protein
VGIATPHDLSDAETLPRQRCVLFLSQLAAILAAHGKSWPFLANFVSKIAIFAQISPGPDKSKIVNKTCKIFAITCFFLANSPGSNQSQNC